jgi:hypothetical protein
MFDGRLIHFPAFRYILQPFIFCCHLVYFPPF